MSLTLLAEDLPHSQCLFPQMIGDKLTIWNNSLENTEIQWMYMYFWMHDFEDNCHLNLKVSIIV